MARLADQIRALPAAQPLLARLDGADGVHLVGGAVRDLLLGLQPRDMDLVVEGDVHPIAERLGGTATFRDDFLTGRVDVDGQEYHLTSARRERYPHPGALPVVEPASLEEDLARRDFTVHALAASLAPGDFGEVRAVPGGLEDLEAARLRVLHERSFLDDPTRILRLVRYAARLGFAIDPDTVLFARHAVGASALDTVSGHRVGDELRLLLGEDRALAALDLADGMDVLTAVDPALRLDRAVLASALELLPQDGSREELLLAGLNLKRDSPSLCSLLERIEEPSPRRVVAIAERAPEVAAALTTGSDPLSGGDSRGLTPSGIAEAVGDAPPEAVALAGALGPRAAAVRWLADLRHVRADIDGNDLLAAGVPAGPAIGAGLRAAHLAKLDGAAPDRDAQLRTALAAAGHG